MSAVEIAPYNPLWPKLFSKEAARITSALGPSVLSIHHIGSTSVPGLPAKPIIDMIVRVTHMEEAIDGLCSLGYENKGSFNLPFQIMLTLRHDLSVNVHLFESDDPEIALNIAFRDYLRTHKSACDAYAQLKKSLAKKEGAKEKQGMLKSYTLGKGAFISNILQKTGFDEARLVYAAHHKEWEAVKALHARAHDTPKGCVDDRAPSSALHHFVMYKGVHIKGCAVHDASRPFEMRIIFEDVSCDLARTYIAFLKKWGSKHRYTFDEDALQSAAIYLPHNPKLAHHCQHVSQRDMHM